MGIEKMSQMTIDGSSDRLDKALMLCCESHAFQISDAAGKGTVLRNLNEQNPYTEAYTKMHDIAVNLGIKPEFRDYIDVKLETKEEFEQYCSEISSEYARLKEEHERISTFLAELRQTDAYVKHLLGMNVSFSELYQLKYIRVRIGRLPAENRQKLDYYSQKCIHFIPFEHSEDYVWGIYLAPADSIEFADMVMDSLYFERTTLPDYLADDADTTDKHLEDLIKKEEQQRNDVEKEIAFFTEKHKDELLAVMSKLKYRSDCFDLRKKVFISGGRFSFSGYSPSADSTALAAKLNTLEDVQAVVVPIKGRDASPDVPVRLKNNVIFRPFEMFVKMYGLPRYGNFDPTPYVAVTYMIMFGIMFGDVGQGLLISLFGLILSKLTKNGLAPIMTRIGLFSAAFGVLYGSVFGIETLITPFFHRESIWRALGYTEQPENIFQVATILLIAALAIGIVLILISMTFNTVLNFSRKNWGEALFSVNGVAGLVLYISLVVALVAMFVLGTNLFTPLYIIPLIVLPIAAIFFRHPLSDLVMGVKREEKISVGNFIIENFIELFEAALSYLSNTMSFLRIGGFILSHAGMMLVVAQLAGTHDPGAEITVGTVITYIIGNLIVMGIEGLLVGIQVLRLEFYEIFNRFYDGSGQSFRPIEISFETEN